MKKLVFICGPNGIGKTTISKHILCKISGSAYVDSDTLRMINPNVLDDRTIPTISANISCIIRNYLMCSAVKNVFFTYGFHGRRREVFEMVINSLEDLEYEFCPLLLECEESENIRRMKCDCRDEERIRRGMDISRKAFDDVNYPRLDITFLSAEKSAEIIIEKFNLTGGFYERN